MSTSGGQVIAQVLRDHGVQYLFTLCGGHISPILVGCDNLGINIIDVRDEANAVFAADAVSRVTGIPGIAAVTAGPGVTNTITALKNAQMAQSPLILLGGAAATITRGRGSLQDIDQMAVLKSIVKAGLAIRRNCDILPVMERAFQEARSGIPGPVFVECPIDLLYEESLVRAWYSASGEKHKTAGLKSKLFQFYLNHHVDKMFACDLDAMEAVPQEINTPEWKQQKREAALKLIRKAVKPVLIIGSQAMLHPHETAPLAKAVEKIGMPVFLTGMARGLLGASSRLQMRHNRKDALQHADLVMIAGMPCDFRLGYGKAISSKAKLISVNLSKSDLTLNRTPDLGIHAGPCEFICALGEAGLFQDNAEWIRSLQDADKRREEKIHSLAQKKTEYVNPLLFLKKLDAFLDDGSIIVADGGDFVGTASYILRPRGPLTWLDPGVFGTLGVGAGFAMGAKLSRPDSEVWLIYGDGSAGYSLQEFDTCVRHNIPLIAVIGNDGGWAQIARDQVEVLKSDVGTRLNRTDYHKVAEGYGGKGFLIDREDQILPTLEQARETAKRGIPVCINLLIGATDFRKGSISM
ncbi:MAG: thiamine pyrophosphate-binding protein [Desulfobacteraceae bacterium]|nr:MAG: thiamine pyrophosphate-binding protein [Desulfobacteraceae bacterium]